MISAYEITIGDKQFRFVRPTIEFVKSVISKDYEKQLSAGLQALFTEEGNKEFEKTWEEFCVDVFEKNWFWRLRLLIAEVFPISRLPRKLQLNRLEFSPEKNELREILTFFFGLLVGTLKRLNGQSVPSPAFPQTVEG